MPTVPEYLAECDQAGLTGRYGTVLITLLPPPSIQWTPPNLLKPQNTLQLKTFQTYLFPLTLTHPLTFPFTLKLTLTPNPYLHQISSLFHHFAATFASIIIEVVVYSTSNTSSLLYLSSTSDHSSCRPSLQLLRPPFVISPICPDLTHHCSSLSSSLRSFSSISIPFSSSSSQSETLAEYLVLDANYPVLLVVVLGLGICFFLYQSGRCSRLFFCFSSFVQASPGPFGLQIRGKCGLSGFPPAPTLCVSRASLREALSFPVGGVSSMVVSWSL